MVPTATQAEGSALAGAAEAIISLLQLAHTKAHCHCTVGSGCGKAPGLELVQNWEECQVHQEVMLTSRGTSPGRRKGLSGTSWSLTRESTKSWLWGGKTPGTRTCQGPSGSQASLQRRMRRGSWWTPALTGASNVPACKKGQQHPGLHLEKQIQENVSALGRQHLD